jgi:MGT family glycosyltransferase
MTFGTVLAALGAAKYVFRTGVRAVRGLPVQVLLTTGSDVARELIGAIPDNVTVESWVPQQEILPHAAAMVCHGGSGTLLGGLAQGVPMVVTPFFADQPDNAERLEQAGAGLAVPELTAGKLRAALERVLGEPRFGERARLIAQSMKRMATVDEAADRILDLAA